MKRSAIVLAIMILLSFIIVDSKVTISLDNNQRILQRRNTLSNLIPHDPIEIIGDDDFRSVALSEGWSGNGSQIDPYIITDYEFSATSEIVQFTNTSLHFIIKNCSFSWSNIEQYSEGVQLRNVTNALIRNCTFSKLTYGIRILYSQNCTLENLTCLDNRWYGISLWNCSDIDVEDSTFVGGLFGLGMSNTPSYCSIKRNTFVNNTLSFSSENVSGWIHDLEDNTMNGLPIGYFYNISNTIIDLSGYGAAIIANVSGIVARNGLFVNACISMGFAQNCVITDVEVRDHRLAVGFEYAINCTLQNSTFDGNYNSFSIGSTCENCTVQNNTIYNTVANAGIRIHGANGTRIINNTLIGSRNLNTEGIEVGGDYCVAANNSISKHYEGIRFTTSYFCNVTNNIVMNNTDSGIYIYRMRNSTFTNNSVFNNSRGVVFSESLDCILVKNNIHHNENDGIEVYASDDCYLTNNTVIYNERYGIWIHEDCMRFQIYYNSVGWNSVENARDDGNSNTWDDNINQGNRWSDLTTETYQITGSAGSIDRYPSVIVDIYPPNVAASHTPSSPLPDQNVTINAQIFDSSALSTVVLSYSTNGGVNWHNISMLYEDSEWTAEIPGLPNNTQVMYKVYAEDVLGHWAWSLIKLYTVQDNEPTTTTTTPVTTTTNITSTTTNGTSTEPFTIEIITIISIGGVIIVVIAIFLKRK